MGRREGVRTVKVWFEGSTGEKPGRGFHHRERDWIFDRI